MRISSLLCWAAAVAGLHGLVVANAPQAQTDPPVRIASPPFIAAVQTGQLGIETSLENSLGIAVEFAAIYRFGQFLEAAVAGHFDLLISPPHVAAYLVEEQDYWPLLRTEHQTQPVLIARRDGEIAGLFDLPGLTVSVPGAHSTTSAVFEVALEASGVPDVAFGIEPTHTHVIMSVLERRTSAGVVADSVLEMLEPLLYESLEIVWRGSEMPRFVFVANPALGDEDILRLESALQLWITSPAAERLNARVSIGGLVPFDEANIAAMRPYSEALAERFARGER